MLSVEDLKVEFGAKPLFQGVNFVVGDRDRIALVGKNGAGKSTMLKIIAGLQQPTLGRVTLSSEMSVGYLPQVMKIVDTTTVREETEKAFGEIHALQREMEQLNRELLERDDYESDTYQQIIGRYTQCSERLQMMGGDNYHAELERTLLGLGFRRTDLDRATCEFSGGWRMRIELAKLLLQAPSLLLLDEPTNHLDIESIQWLEEFLSRRSGSVMLVSHDRAFIEHVTNRTIEISCGRIYDYRVKYSEFVQLRKERREQQLRAYENQQREIAETKDFIERFRYKPTKAVQVQSRIKALERIVPIEIDDVDNRAMHLRFPPSQRSGSYPVVCESLTKSYGNHKVFGNVNISIKRGEKVALVGRNGEGKSTFVKCLMGEIGYEGSLRLGHNVQIGYYAQNEAQLLDDNMTIYDTIDNVATGAIRTRINDILGAFMFGGEENQKRVGVLSGGERSRLAMIRLLLSPVNLLILDEPTNHLDMASKDVLKGAISSFDGTVIVVSHDREFLDGLVEKVYEFSDGSVREYIGGIYDFLQRKGVESVSDIGKIRGEEPSNPSSKSSDVDGRADYLAQKESERKKRRLERRVVECEAEVDRLIMSIKELEEALSHMVNGYQEQIYREYNQLKSRLTAAEREWEDAMLEYEKIKL